MTMTLMADPATRRPTGCVTVPRVLRSEWIKLRSLRSTVWSYAIIVAVSVGLALLMSLSAASAHGAVSSRSEAVLLAQAATFGTFFGQLIVAVLGVLVISGEYSTGMIRSTLTAVPRRLPALWAKAAVLFVASAVVGLVGNAAALATAAPILASKGYDAIPAFGDLAVPLIVAAFYLVIVSVFALGLGTLIRSSAGGVSTALGLILLLPIVVIIPPIQWVHNIAPYLMMNAGLASFGLDAIGGPSPLTTWQQLLVIIAWAVVALASGAVRLRRRDA